MQKERGVPTLAMQAFMDKLKFDEKGIIPAVVQDAATGEVLTLAYMSRESLAISMEEGRTCFYSRSRQTLWRKGETSGNVQHIVEIRADCDYDALVVRVQKEGPACHMGVESCFHNPLFITTLSNSTPLALAQDGPIRECPAKEEGSAQAAAFSVDALYALIQARKQEMPEGSYTTYLFEKGIEKILKKVGEECTEVVIGAMKRDRAETVYEVADLCYHVLVLLCEMGIPVADIRKELENRHVIDHKTKQETMQ